MTVAELDLSAMSNGWGQNRRSALAEHLERFVIQDSTRDLCQTWARVTDEARRRGRPITAADAWHAAVALLEDLPPITHNRNDYVGVPGLRVISEAP